MSESTTDGKRKRPNYVSKACDNCRKKHLKCDGNTPCSRCVKSNLECSSEAVLQKRGQAPGKLAELEETLDSVRRQLEEQKRVNQELEEALGMRTNKKQQRLQFYDKKNQTITFSPYNKIGSNHLITLLSYYTDFGLPFCGIPLPQLSLERYWSGELEARSYLLLNSILALSSMIFGNTEASKDFYRAAKTTLKDLYHDLHSYTAASCTLLGIYQMINMKTEKSDLLTSNSRSLCKILFERYIAENRAPDDPSFLVIRGIYANSIYKRLTDTKSELEFVELVQELKRIKRVSPIYFNQDISQYGLLLGRLRCLLHNPSTWRQSLAIIDQGQFALSRHSNAKIKEIFSIVLKAFRAFVFSVGGMHEEAIKCNREALQALPFCCSTPTSMHVLFAMGVVGQIFMDENCVDELLQVVDMFQKYTHMPLALEMQRLLMDPIVIPSSPTTTIDTTITTTDTTTSPEVLSHMNDGLSSLFKFVDVSFPSITSQQPSPLYAAPIIDAAKIMRIVPCTLHNPFTTRAPANHQILALEQIDSLQPTFPIQPESQYQQQHEQYQQTEQQQQQQIFSSPLSQSLDSFSPSSSSSSLSSLITPELYTPQQQQQQFNYEIDEQAIESILNHITAEEAISFS